MGTIVAVIVFGILGLVALGIAIFAPKRTELGGNSYRNEPKYKKTHAGVIGSSIAAVLLLLAGIIFFAGMYHKVPARNIGIVSNGGKVYDETLSPGRHWLAPYKSVEMMDTTIQTLHFKGDKADAEKGIEPSVGVRLSNQTTATVDVTVLWHVSLKTDDAVTLYKSYKNNKTGVMDNVRDSLVVQQVIHAMALVYSQYNPLAGLTTDTSTTQLSYDDLEKQVITKLTPLVPNITIVSFTINQPHYDQTTQDQLNKYAQTLAAERIAEEQAKVNQAIVDANNILANSASSKDPGVQYQQCLQILRDLAQSGQLGNLPPNTLSCGNGNNGSVIVQSK